MTPTAFDAPHLYRTQFGSVHRSASGDHLEVAFGAHTLQIEADGLRHFRDSVAALASNAWRYERPCRWQLRIQTAPDQPVVVLCSDDVYRLKALLDGAAAMLELEDMLEEAQIECASVSSHVEE